MDPFGLQFNGETTELRRRWIPARARHQIPVVASFPLQQKVKQWQAGPVVQVSAGGGGGAAAVGAGAAVGTGGEGRAVGVTGDTGSGRETETAP